MKMISIGRQFAMWREFFNTAAVYEIKSFDELLNVFEDFSEEQSFNTIFYSEQLHIGLPAMASPLVQAVQTLLGFS